MTSICWKGEYGSYVGRCHISICFCLFRVSVTFCPALALLLLLSPAARAWRCSCLPCHCHLRSFASALAHGHSVKVANCDDLGLGAIPANVVPYDVEILSLKRNNITNISGIEAFTQAKVLRIDFNHIDTLTPGTFNRSRNSLMELSVRGNDLLAIEENSFQGLTRLQILKGLRTQTLSSKAFFSLPSLRVLHLETPAEELSDTIFNSNTKLEILRLKLPLVKSLPLKMFEPCPKLQRLYLTASHLTVFPAETFDGLGHLRIISLELPELQTMPEDVFHSYLNHGPLSALSEIRITGTLHIPKDTFNGLSNLARLSVTHSINFSAWSFSNTTSIKHLELSSNGLEYVTATHLHQLPNLTSLNVSHNLLETFPKTNVATSFCSSLKVLDLSHNRLSTLGHHVFSSLGDSLTHLNLSNNMIQHIPSATLSRLKTLVELRINNNFLQELFPSSLPCLPVSILSIDDNQLSRLELDKVSSVFPGIERLSASGNNMRILDLTSEIPSSLKTLDVSRNAITEVIFPSYQRFCTSKLLKLNLTRNPIHCTCSIVQTLRNESCVEIYPQANCASPPALNGTPVVMVTASHVCASSVANNYSDWETTFIVCLGLMMLLIVIVVALCRNRDHACVRDGHACTCVT